MSLLDGALQVAAERRLFDHAGDDGAHRQPQNHRERRVLGGVKILLLGQPNQPAQHPLQQHHADEADHAGEQRRAPHLVGERVAAGAHAPQLGRGLRPSGTADEVAPIRPQIDRHDWHRPRPRRCVPGVGAGQPGPWHGTGRSHGDADGDGADHDR